MANVTVEKIRGGDAAAPPTFLDRIEAIFERVQKRAFEVFQGRGCGEGRSLDDWLQAERDVIQPAQADLTEKDGKFQARIAVPGFELKDIHVTAMPTALIVDGETKHGHKKTDADVLFCEFDQKQLFRRLDLPSRIDCDKVTATLEHGILELTVPKAAATKLKAIAAA